MLAAKVNLLEEENKIEKIGHKLEKVKSFIKRMQKGTRESCDSGERIKRKSQED